MLLAAGVFCMSPTDKKDIYTGKAYFTAVSNNEANCVVTIYYLGLLQDVFCLTDVQFDVQQLAFSSNGLVFLLLPSPPRFASPRAQ